MHNRCFISLDIFSFCCFELFIDRSGSSNSICIDSVCVSVRLSISAFFAVSLPLSLVLPTSFFTHGMVVVVVIRCITRNMKLVIS